jgi:hypothetical protein
MIFTCESFQVVKCSLWSSVCSSFYYTLGIGISNYKGHSSLKDKTCGQVSK